MGGEEFARIYSWGNDPMRKVCPRYHGKYAMTKFHRGIMKLQVLAVTSICRKLSLSQY